MSGLVIVMASFGMLALGGQSLWALIVGVVLLDLGVQGVHINNQSVIYAPRTDTRSRITAVFTTTYSIGGALGSATAASAFELGGWMAVCALGAAFGAVAFVLDVGACTGGQYALSRWARNRN